MNILKRSLKTLIVVLYFISILSVANMSMDKAYAHGGKKHGDNEFTAFKALQKATALYDRLIINGKLDETWETGLKSIDVNTRENNGMTETRVGFHRSEGTPGAVYIFFTADGNYSGSNFDGKW